jgi:hypothetical protein
VTSGPVIPKATDGDEEGGTIIAEVIVHEKESARAATTSSQARELAVISSAGTLVTLLFGLSALATKAADFVLPSATKLPLHLAAAFLVAAAIAGIATNAPRRSDVMALKNLRPLIEGELWHVPAFHAEQEIARTRLTIAENARTLNITMSRFLLAAIILEIAGVACVTWAVITLIASA